MLLTTRINAITSQIDAYLAEIAELQNKVTQLQSHAQEVQGVEQACESALIQIDTAISMLQAICPDEITTFKQAIDARFTAPLPQLVAVVDTDFTETESSIVVPLSDEEILQIIRELDKELGTENYLPIFHLRNKLSLTRDEVDQALYRLQKANLIELSTLQEANAYQPEEIDAGIPQNIGGPLFFIIVDEDKTSPATVDMLVGEVEVPEVQNLASYEDLKQCDRPALVRLANKHGIQNYKHYTRDVLAKKLVGKITQEELN